MIETEHTRELDELNRIERLAAVLNLDVLHNFLWRSDDEKTDPRYGIGSRIQVCPVDDDGILSGPVGTIVDHKESTFGVVFPCDELPVGPYVLFSV